jgi:hypothetical protein
MTLRLTDLPEGASLAEESPLHEARVTDGHARSFAMCDCRLGDSVPLAVTSETMILEKEPYARLMVKALAGEPGRKEFVRGFLAGAGGTIKDATTEPLDGPDIADQSGVFSVAFAWNDVGPGIGYVGVVRVREVVGLVAMLGLEGDIQAKDLHPLMERAAARIRGESPPPAAESDGPSTAPAPVGQSA